MHNTNNNKNLLTWPFRRAADVHPCWRRKLATAKRIEKNNKYKLRNMASGNKNWEITVNAALNTN